MTKSTRGYWYVWMPEHHKANKHGYVKRANVVLEKKLGRRLEDNEIAHHKNEDKEDDSWDNLELMTIEAHNHHHGQMRSLRHPPKLKQPDHPCNRRYQWPPNEILLSMRETMTLRAIAKRIGCNFKSVHRRINKLLRHN